MLKIIEYTLVSVDGVFANPGVSAFMGYRDDAYMRDGLAALMGAMRCRWAGRPMKTLPRWPGQGHPWADGLNFDQEVRSLVETETGLLEQLGHHPGRRRGRGDEAQTAGWRESSRIRPWSARRDFAEAKPAQCARRLHPSHVCRVRKAVVLRRRTDEIEARRDKNLLELVKLMYEPQY